MQYIAAGVYKTIVVLIVLQHITQLMSRNSGLATSVSQLLYSNCKYTRYLGMLVFMDWIRQHDLCILSLEHFQVPCILHKQFINTLV